MNLNPACFGTMASEYPPVYCALCLCRARCEEASWPQVPQPVSTIKHGHYRKEVSHLGYVDVYRVLDLYQVTDPCIQHAIKKLLVAGGRGVKDAEKDISEAMDALARWQEMQKENACRS